MLLKFFGSSYLFQYFLLLLIAGALWLPAFLHPLPVMPGDPLLTPIYYPVAWALQDLALVAVIAGFLAMLVLAFIVNSILSYHDLIPKNSLIPSLVFIVFFSSFTPAHTLTPVLLVLFPLTAMLHQLFRLHEQEENINLYLNAGLLCALASMIYFPSIILLIFVFQVLLIYRIFYWRSWIIVIIGFILPFAYLCAYFWWTDQFHSYFEMVRRYITGYFQPGIMPAFSVFLRWAMILVLIAVPAFFKTLSSLGGHNIGFRKKMTTAAWLLPFGILMIFAGGDYIRNALVYLPLTIIASYFYSLKKRSLYNEITFLIYLLTIFALNIFSG